MPDKDNHNPAFIACALLAVLLIIQIAVPITHMSEPFIDGTSHWYHDNAMLLRMAAHSNDDTIGDWRKVFGLSIYGYNSQGQPESVRHYSHHGVISPMVFHLVTKIFGSTETVLRAYCLFLSLIVTSLLFFLLLTQLKNPLLAFLPMLMYALLPLKFTYIDVWKYPTVAELSCFAALLSLAIAHRNRRSRPVFLVCMFAMFHADWPAYIIAFWIAVYLFAKRKDENLGRLWIGAVVTGAIGVATAFAIQYALGFDIANIGETLAKRTSGDMEAVAFGDYLVRQALYLNMNFGDTAILLGLAAVFYLLITRKVFDNFLLVCGWMFLAMQLIWLLTFRNHAYIHHDVQWYFGPAIILLISGVLARFREAIQANPAAQHAMIAVFIPVCVMVSIDMRQMQSTIQFDIFGQPDDIRLIRAIDKRIVVMPDGVSGKEAWWTSQVMQLYNDPVFRGSVSPGIRFHNANTKLDPTAELLVMIKDPSAQAGFKQHCQAAGVRKVFQKIESSSFIFFEFDLNPPDTPTPQ